MSTSQNSILLNGTSRLLFQYDLIIIRDTRFFNGVSIGSCRFRADVVNTVHTVYPCFALYSAGQEVAVDFQAAWPAGEK